MVDSTASWVAGTARGVHGRRPRTNKSGGRIGGGPNPLKPPRHGPGRPPVSYTAHTWPTGTECGGPAPVGTSAHEPSHTDGVQAALEPHGEVGGEALDEPDGTQPSLSYSFLLVFSGKGVKQNRLATRLRRGGHRVTEVDTALEPIAHNVLDRGHVLQPLLDGIAGDQFDAGWIATPCESYLLDFAPKIRSRGKGRGWDGTPREWVNYVRKHDALADITAEIWSAFRAAGKPAVVENPSDRADRASPAYWKDRGRDHCPLWVQPGIAQLIRDGATLVHSPHCAWAEVVSVQKWITLLMPSYTPAGVVESMSKTCTHSSHPSHAFGRLEDGSSASAATAEYPDAFDEAAAAALIALVESSPARDERGPTVGGRVSDGPALHQQVRAELERERARVPSFAAAKRLHPASRNERIATPFPRSVGAPMAPRTKPRISRRGRKRAQREWAAGETPEPMAQPVSSGAEEQGYSLPAPGMEPRAPRAQLPRGAPSGDIHISQLFTGNEAAESEDWFRRARTCQKAWRAGEAHERIEDYILLQSQMHQWGRGFVWDTRDPGRCKPVQRSDRNFVFPGERQLDRAAFRQACHDLRWHDLEIANTAGEGGVEVNSGCDLTMVLAMHHKGVVDNFAAADKVIQAERLESWVRGPESASRSSPQHGFYQSVPFVPCRLLPRNVVLQQRVRLLPTQPGDAPDRVRLESYEKPRITQNSSYTPGVVAAGVATAVNAEIPGSETLMSVPSAQDHACGAGIVEAMCTDLLGQPLLDAEGREIHAEQYAVDEEAAFRFCPINEEDCWTQCFFWDEEQSQGEGSDGLSESGALLDGRCGFGGAFGPQKFERISLVGAALARKRQAEFDAANPFHPGIERAIEQRRHAQSLGLIPGIAGSPEGDEQVAPRHIQAFIDDTTGSSTSERFTIPPDVAHIEIEDLAVRAIGEQPAHSSSRASIHARILIKVLLAIGFAVSGAKTQCSRNIIVLGLLSAGTLDRLLVPRGKRAALRTEIASHRLAARDEARADAKKVEKLVGRCVHISQAEPSILSSLHSGYTILRTYEKARTAAAARAAVAARSRIPKVLRLKAGGDLQLSWLFMLDVVEEALEQNRGVPLMYARLFPATDTPGTYLSTTDASGIDGVGGYVFRPEFPQEVWLVSVAWPQDILEALSRSGAGRTQEGASLGSVHAELFGMFIVPAVVAHHTPPAPRFVAAVGDCEPAVFTLRRGAARDACMHAILSDGERPDTFWLPVHVRRTANLDADLLSHPRELEAVARTAEAAGYTVHRITELPGGDAAWAPLRAATLRRG